MPIYYPDLFGVLIYCWNTFLTHDICDENALSILQVWDLGGQDTLRPSWATYYRGTNAVVIVVDSTDRARISIVRDELFRLLEHEELQPSVVLVFANKQDVKGAMTPAEITNLLSLHDIKNHDWHIQPSCALTGEGLYDGLGWIAQHVSQQKSGIWITNEKGWQFETKCLEFVTKCFSWVWHSNKMCFLSIHNVMLV